MLKLDTITYGKRFPYNLRELLNPMNYVREIKYARQRLRRGWSDRDTWNGGEYLLGVVSGVLKKLGDSKSHIDWDEYFKTNYPNNRGYTSLYQVADDIDQYLEFDDAEWVDTLGFELKSTFKDLPNGMSEYVDLNTAEEKRKVRKAIDDSHTEWERRYKRARNAMWFVATNFPGLWD